MSPHFNKRQDYLNFNCPVGGTWYACAKGSKFVGCCASDPCTNGCAQGSVYQAAFNASMFEKFPDASCGVGSDFYTCGFASTFWGCCKTNPCSAGAICPRGDLVPAFLDRPEQFNIYASTAISSSATSSPTASTSPSSSNGGSSSGIVIGAAVGGGIGLALVIGILVWVLCRRNKKRKQQQYTSAPVTDAAHPSGQEKTGASDSTYYSLQSPPPTYTSPNPNSYSDSPHASKGNYYEQYAHISDTPQELPGDGQGLPLQTRYSELPAGSSNQRYSELPAGAVLASAELESPQTSPQPQQTEFRQDVAKTGLGMANVDKISRH